MDTSPTPSEETPHKPEHDAADKAQPVAEKSFIKKFWWVGVLLLVIIVGGTVFAKSRGKHELGSETYHGGVKEEAKNGDNAGDGYSSDAVEKGMALSRGKCTGTGSKELTSPPMRPADTSVILPYGLMASGHVTPIDHQYYWGKVQHGTPDQYDVLAPADGTIVDISYRSHAMGGGLKGDYRVVIAYSCTFFSYFDLATSMSADIAATLPAGWEQEANKSPSINYPVKAGQVIAKMGDQSLDFAVWDTSKPLTHFLVPTAYNNVEPWKIVSVPPMDYYSAAVKAAITPLYARTAAPMDGVIDQDVDGTAMGGWFKVGSNGYLGNGNSSSEGGGYWSGHLAFAKDYIDPEGGYVFSTGNWSGQAQQFGIITPSVKPDALTVESGMVKYQVGGWEHNIAGVQWFSTGPGAIKFTVPKNVSGTVLVQLMEKRLLKVEAFPGKTASQVTGFTSAAVTYNRGDDAVKGR
jgi:hypothetical protein